MPNERTSMGTFFGICAFALGLSLIIVVPTAAQTTGDADRAAPPAEVRLTVPGSQSQDTTDPQGAIFRVGILASASPALQRTRLDPFRLHLEGILARPVEFVPFREARGLMAAMDRSQISYAIAPGSMVAATEALCNCVDPLGAQPTSGGGTGVFAALATRADSGITQPSALSTVPTGRLAIVGEGSVVAHHIGLSELSRAGVGLRVDAPYRFVASLDEALALVASKDADAALFWTPQAAGPSLSRDVPGHALSDDVRQAVRIIWRSRPAIGTTHFAHTALDADVREALQSALLLLANQNGVAFDAVDTGSGRPFVDTNLADYLPHTDAMAFWGLEVSNDTDGAER